MFVKRGHESGVVRSIQEMLKYLGFEVKERKGDVFTFKPLEVDGKFGADTEGVVLAFQGSEGLIRDGIVGPNTMKKLEDNYTQRVLEINSPGVDATDGMPDRFVFERVKADKFQEGYGQLSLRNDVSSVYNDMLEEVHAKGGKLTSSGGIRSLKTGSTRSRSATSFHYLGLALDLYIYSGMVEPASDPYVIKREKARSYRVYCRCKEEFADVQEIDKVISYSNRVAGESITGSFFDLTALFKSKGFKPIKARPTFEHGTSILGAEWWHFQYEKGLISGGTTFGSELLKVYSRETLDGTDPWMYRDRIYGINWS